MKIERMSIYNLYGITSKQKSIIYNALNSYQKGFGQGDETYNDIKTLLDRFYPTDDAPMIKSEKQDFALNAALETFDDKKEEYNA